MSVTYDNNNNAAYTFEMQKNSIKRGSDYWMPERKSAAILIMRVAEGVSNRQDYIGNRDYLIAQWYDPCKKCNPKIIVKNLYKLL